MCVYVGVVQDKIPTGSKEGMKEGGKEGVARTTWKVFKINVGYILCLHLAENP